MIKNIKCCSKCHRSCHQVAGDVWDIPGISLSHGYPARNMMSAKLGSLLYIFMKMCMEQFGMVAERGHHLYLCRIVVYSTSKTGLYASTIDPRCLIRSFNPIVTYLTRPRQLQSDIIAFLYHLIVSATRQGNNMLQATRSKV